MTTTVATTQFKLVAISDLREYDYLRQEYIPLEKGEGNICERCGREHAKVFVVRDLATTTKDYYVGSTCCKKLLNWEPSKEEIQSVEMIRKNQQKTESQKRMQEFMQNGINALVQWATRTQQTQGYVEHKAIDEKAIQYIATVFTGKKLETLSERLIRKFLCTRCPMVLR